MDDSNITLSSQISRIKEKIDLTFFLNFMLYVLTPRFNHWHGDWTNDPLTRCLVRDKAQARFNNYALRGEPLFTTCPPFSWWIMKELIPCRFKASLVETYDNTTNPYDHLERYKALMILQWILDALICKSFPSTLQDNAQAWYTRLQSDSIHSFEEFGHFFATQFQSSRRLRVPMPSSLSNRRMKNHFKVTWLASKQPCWRFMT